MKDPALIFIEKNHSYQSFSPEDKIDWTSVTAFVNIFKKKFDPIAQSIKSSKNPRSKWYGLPPEEIQKHWSDEANRAATTGTAFHNQREADLTGIDTIERCGVQVPIIKPIYQDGVKYAPDQKLVEGIYPEHLVYLKSAGICGQSDRVEVVKGVVDIVDYKTNKEIKTKGFTNWEGITDKMLGPCAHLDDCNYNHYALQLSTYLYIILKQNPIFRPGKLSLHHIIFQKEAEDKFGNPIYKKDENGDPIVEKLVSYEVPYLKEEVKNMIAWLQDNKTNLKK